MPSPQLRVKVLSPDGVLFEGEAKSVRLPGALGSFSVLPRHAPLISELTSGTITIRTSDDASAEFEIGGGVVEVLNNQITVLVERAKKK